MTVLTFWVEGVPVPKGRPRTVVKAGRTMTYTPATTREWEDLVRLQAQAACSAGGWKPLPGKYTLDLQVYRKARRGDWDNFGKAISDALNGLVFPDDASVVDGRVRVFDGQGTGAMVRVTREPCA